MRKYGTLALKIILWIIGVLIFIVLAVFVLIRVPAVQNWARGKAVTFLEGKIGTKVEVNKISLDLPKLIVLEDIYFEDQKKDTLIAGDTLKVDVSLLKLLDNQLEINEVDLRGITLNVTRNADSVFNFDYIVKAFAGEQKKEPAPQDSSSTMKFSVEKINLDRIKVKYADAPTANSIDLYLGHFDTRIKDFDLDKMSFNIPKVALSGVNVRMVQQKPAVEPKTMQEHEAESAEPMNLNLKFGTLDLSKIKVYYQNDISAMKADVDLGKAIVEAKNLDLKNQNIQLENFELKDSRILFQLGKKAEARQVAEETAEAAEATANNWKFSSDKISLAGNNVQFDNFNMPATPRGMDFGHLAIKNLNLGVDKLSYTIDSISGSVNEGSFSDKSGFVLKKLNTDFFYGPRNAYLQNLDIQTGNSRIRDDIRVSYPGLANIAKYLGEVGIDANLKDTRIGINDILLLAPDMATTMPLQKGSALNINARIKGKVKSLEIPNLQISGLSGTNIQASAKTRGLPDVNKAWLDINIKNFSTRRSDILSLLPKGTLPNNISLPQNISVKGHFKGGINAFNTDLNLNSSYGNLRTIATYDARSKGNETYKANIRAFNIDAGKFIKNDSIGKITLAANVVGRGLDPKTMRAKFTARIIKAEYNRYAYRNLNVNGSAGGGEIIAKADMADPNVRFNLDAKANMSGKYPAARVLLNLDSINLQNINIMKDDMRFHGKLFADLKTADPDYLNGEVLLTEAIMARGSDRFSLDTVSITSTASADSNSLKLRSEFVSADIGGKYKLTQLGAAFQDLIGNYFKTASSTAVAKYDPQRMNFDMRVVSTPLLRKLVPDLKELATVTLRGNFDSQRKLLQVDGSAPRVLYGTNEISNLLIKVNTTDSALNYALNVSRISAGQFQFYAAKIAGDIQNNTISTEITTADKKNKQNYKIAGALNAMNDVYKFSLKQDGLMLNYTPWTVSANNAIQFGGKGIQATDFTISNNNQSLSVNTNPPGFNNPLEVNFKNFKIETLTNIAGQDSLLIGGTINGGAIARNLNASPVFTADLKVDNFSFKGDTVGNITAKVNNETAGSYAANVSITGNGNEVNLTGNYLTTNSSFDMKLNIANLSLKSIEGFTMGNIRNATGSLKGDLDIQGTVDAPQIRGGLRFDNMGFNVAMLNSYFKVDNAAAINFVDDGIRLENFSLIDSVNNKASLNGTVFTKTYRDYRFDLSLDADNFRVLNSTAADNDLYYGKLFINTRLKIKGTMEAPAVDGSLKINPKTDVFFVLPASDPGIEDRKGIVEFIDKDHPALAKVFKQPADSLNKSGITGMDISVNVELDKEAILNVVVDPANGDMLTMRGDAQLTGGIDPSGKTSLTGNLTIEEGSYNLSFNFLKRKFEIKKGSTLDWNGDPMGATVDITAVYTANTAPLDLVESQLGGASQSALNTYKQKLPFDVNLMMKGELMKPELTFDILLPEGNYNVSTDIINNVNGRLTQLRSEPSELNKQVFALLLLNRFISENPFASSGGGGGLESTARQSVSGLLSDQLNNLAGDLIDGVDLNFDLQSTEDYTTGQMRNRTDLNVGVSKRLLNDRLKVSVGSNFELEGPRQENRKTSNIAGDIKVEYQLSRNGRYLLRAYQKNEYQVALQGQVIETGVGFVINLDYNKFKEIFRNADKERRRRRAAEKAAKEKIEK